ncbi:MAG: phospholipase, partial [Ramlibacter sp.]|nr:phospholipase [Ramlibacter sp.]
MKNAAVACLAASLLLGAATDASAWSQETHRRIAIDAVNYMKANPTTTNYAKLLNGATKAGLTIDQFAAALGQGAYDVDDFADTYLCGATTGDCQLAP